MFLSRDADSSKDDEETEFPACSLPELYALAENFNKKSKKSSRLKTHGMSPSEAQKILSQNLNAMSFTSGTDLREDPQSVLTCKVVRKEEERPASLTELLHRSLLTTLHSELDRLAKSQQRLAQHGIPPPLHTFPYEILIENSNFWATTRKRIQNFRRSSKPSFSRSKPDKFLFEDKISEYLLVEPGTLNR
ncbi:uncharacterized protein C9orf153 homolog [Molossus nigricans]